MGDARVQVGRFGLFMRAFELEMRDALPVRGDALDLLLTDPRPERAVAEEWLKMKAADAEEE